MGSAHYLQEVTIKWVIDTHLKAALISPDMKRPVRPGKLVDVRDGAPVMPETEAEPVAVRLEAASDRLGASESTPVPLCEGVALTELAEDPEGEEAEEPVGAALAAGVEPAFEVEPRVGKAEDDDMVVKDCVCCG